MKSNEKVRVAFVSYVTNSCHLNYGATLHGYAFQRVLNKLGCENVCIDYMPKSVAWDNLKYPLFRKEKNRTILAWCAVKLSNIISFYSNIVKYNKFQSFISKNMRVTTTYYSYNALANAEKLEENPDVFVCESDVIWKFLDEPSFDGNFFLDFPAARNKRKVAYAPTISAKKWSQETIDKFKSLTRDFDAISTREEPGSEYLSDLLKKEIPWVLDPTLLLSEEDYLPLIVKPKEEHYLLIYNCTVNDRFMVAEACRYAKRSNLKVIEISNYAINGLYPPHEVKCNVGIEEWLGYIKYSSAFCTNSFHGLCFAVIFKKDVFLFQRDRSDYRMPNIVNKLAMDNCFIAVENRKIPTKPIDVEWRVVYENLDVYRRQSYKFISDYIVK